MEQLPIFSTLEHDLENWWYPRILGIYGKEDPFTLTQVDLTNLGEYDLVTLTGHFQTRGIKEQIEIYADEFCLEMSSSGTFKTYRLTPVQPRFKAYKLKELIKDVWKLKGDEEYLHISIHIDGNETFDAEDYSWDRSGDWLVLKGVGNPKGEHYMYIPGDADVQMDIRDLGHYVVHFNQIYTH